MFRPGITLPRRIKPLLRTGQGGIGIKLKRCRLKRADAGCHCRQGSERAEAQRWRALKRGLLLQMT